MARRPYSQVKGPGPGHWDRQAVKPLSEGKSYGSAALARVLARQQAKGGEFCGDVSSTAINAIDYNDSLGRLTVTFNSGRRYAYFDVEGQRYRAFCEADSKGRFFNKQIRDKYAYTRLG